MCVILYNTCETGHIESSVLLSLSASCYCYVYVYPDSDPDHSQNLIGSKLDQDPSSDFLSMGSSETCTSRDHFLSASHDRTFMNCGAA